MTVVRLFLSTGVLLIMALVAVQRATAQVTEDQFALLNEIIEISNSITEETAREGQAKCAALTARLDAMTDLAPLQRISFESEIDSCISYAMHRGGYSDETGDQCSFHLAAATKLARVITEGRGQPAFTPEVMMTLGDRLRSAMRIGPGMGCTSDYAAFEAVAALAEEEAAKPPPEGPFALWDKISSAAYSINPGNARDVQKACLAFQGDIDAVAERPVLERLFYEGLVADCVARAMVTGEYSDESGDACAYHFRLATKFAEGAAAGKTVQGDAEVIVGYMREELKVAKRQGPGMGCKQDYASLKEE